MSFFAELLSSQSCSPSDLVSVTLLVPSMSDYADVNAEYVKNFGANPPVRVCVQPAPRLMAPAMSAVGFRRSDVSNFDIVDVLR